MGERRDLDLYGSGATPGRTPVTAWIVRIAGLLVGAAITFYGLALYALRCFDTCPEDPAVDTATLLMATAIVLFGLVVAIASASGRTRWAVGGATVVAALGFAIAAVGIASLAQVPRIDDPGGQRSDVTLAGAAATAVGTGVATAAIFRRRKGPRQAD